MALKDIVGGVSDTFRNLQFAMAYSLGWWVAVLLVLPAPGATIALFHLTDPRIVHADDRRHRREVFDLVGTYLWSGWRLALLIGSIEFVAVWNLVTFGRRFSSLTVLAPLWLTICLTGSLLGFFAASSMGMFNYSIRLGLTRGAAILVERPVASLALLLTTGLALLAGAALVLPLVLFVPALVTSIVNRFVLRSLGVPVPDALEPTAERILEKQRDQASRTFGP